MRLIPGIEYRLSLLLLCALLLTNRYLSLPADVDWVDFAGGDSFAYLEIAKAFPALLVDVVLSAHLAQRFFFPYLMGGVAWISWVPVEHVFLVFAVLVVLAVVLLFHRILDRLGLEPETKMILLSLLVLNAYMFRYHLAIPWMISDLGFQLGLAVVMLGLVRQSAGLTLAGLLAAALAKQTALLVLPGLMGWIWWEWKSRARSVRALHCAGAGLLAVAVYAGTAWMSRRFSGPGVVGLHALGLFRWLTAGGSPAELLVFGLRCVIGFAFPAALLLSLAAAGGLRAGWYRDRRFWLGLLLTGAICVQPLLGGPGISGPSATRLAMLGYVPLLIGLAAALAGTSLPERARRRLLFLSAFTLVTGSFHHFYSFLGTLDTGRASRFVTVYLASALLLFLGSLVVQRSERAR